MLSLTVLKEHWLGREVGFKRTLPGKKDLCLMEETARQGLACRNSTLHLRREGV